MSNLNYNSILQSNNIDLQEVLQTLQNKAVSGGGEQATPLISVDSNGLITATAGTKSATKQLAFQAAKTITPSTINQVAVSSGYYTGGDIVVKGDSNLIAENIKNGVSIFGVSGTLEEGSDGSGELVDYSENEDAIITRNISTYTNDRVTTIGSYAFYWCTELTSANFPVCRTIGSYAFYWCTELTSANFPVCRTIDNHAFEFCSKLTSVNFPVCTTIGSYAFEDCNSLTSANFPLCTIIYTSAFGQCNLTSVNFPVCTTIGNYAFEDCNSLTSANFPLCTIIHNYAFDGCYRLSQLYLTGSSVCKLSNSNAFQSTPYAGYSSYFSGTPWIYVPASLISAYRSATNWVYFSSYFSAIVIEEPITFYVEYWPDSPDPYKANENMRWDEYVDSEYNNSADFVILDNIVYYDLYDDMIPVKYDGENVAPSDIIISNRTYAA